MVSNGLCIVHGALDVHPVHSNVLFSLVFLRTDLQLHESRFSRVSRC